MRAHTPRKRFGQHFLHNIHIVNKIIAVINPQAHDHIVEIGPGLGVLTTPLLPLIAKLDAIELDRDLCVELQQKFHCQQHFSLYQADILKFDLTQLIINNHQHLDTAKANNIKQLRIIGNLPYNISTPLLFKLLQNANYIIDMHFMLQKEVAHRLAAAPGDKSYGRLSVMAQYYCKIYSLFDVNATAFKPAPKVRSAIVKLIPHIDITNTAVDFDLFKNLTTIAFNQRRKIIQNTLKKVLSTNDFIKLNIDPQSRPEQLSVADFVTLSNYVYQLNNK